MNTTLPITIAVVDDHSFVREGVSNMLSLMGFEVIIQAENGKDFIRQLADAAVLPRLCLLDIHMPVMNGIETAKAMKETWPGIKILAYTFNNLETEKMLESGADACILKCCASVELNKAILEILSVVE